MLTSSITALLGFAIGILLCYLYYRRQLDFQKQDLISEKEIELNSLHHEHSSLKSSIDPNVESIASQRSPSGALLPPGAIIFQKRE